MTNKAPWYARLARTLGLTLPIFLVVSALGTKFGLWGWQAGLAAAGLGGAIWIGVTALLAIISIIVLLVKGKRLGIGAASVGLIIAAAFAAFFAPIVMDAGNHPIHDMSTDTSNPPAFSETVLTARTNSEANPINAYDVPLSQTKQFAKAEEPRASQTYADIIAAGYPELEPLGIGETTTNDAVTALETAMADMGFSDIRYNEEAGTVEGVAETFWFGFKDDVVARIAEGKIDFRSVSRVGQSDLGANAKRIMELRAKVAEKLKL